MTRNRAGAALVLVLAAAGAAMSWYIGTLSAVTEPPADDAHPRQWWVCTDDAITGAPTPPDCLTNR